LLDVGIAPKLPTIFTGREKFRDSTAVASFRTTLGLGTMATQNSNNVSITGGNMSGLGSVSGSSSSFTTANSTYVYTSYLFTGYGYANGSFSVGSTSYGNHTFYEAGTLGEETAIVTTAGTLNGNYTHILLDGTTAAACSGSASTACSTYTNYSDCSARSFHGGCAWNDIPCYTWSGTDSSTCTSGHSGCTWETASCSGFGDSMTCTSYSGCSWVTCSGYVTV
jgi:hypothetical protein